MKFLIQICQNASVKINDSYFQEIGKGEVVFVGFSNTDNESIVNKMIEKLLKLRIFKDCNDKTNLNIDQYNGEILFISQFTLYANLENGNRPSFTEALSCEKSKILYDYTCDKLKEKFNRIKFGIFQQDMKVSLVNDGPFTIILDSDKDI